MKLMSGLRRRRRRRRRLCAMPEVVTCTNSVECCDTMTAISSTEHGMRSSASSSSWLSSVTRTVAISIVYGSVMSNYYVFGTAAGAEQQMNQQVYTAPPGTGDSHEAVNNNNAINDSFPMATPSNQSSNSATAAASTLQFPLYMRILATLACFIIFTIGVCGNLLVPLVVIKTKYLRNSTNLFLINLSVADLLVLTVCMPTVLIELHSRPETWPLGPTMCKVSNFVETLAANGSIFTILAISFERYYAICKPLKAGYKCTRLRATIIICLIWLLSSILTSPISIMAQSDTIQYIDGSWVNTCILDTSVPWKRMYVVVSMIAFYCLPSLVLMFVYWLISRRLIRESLAMRAPHPLMRPNCSCGSCHLTAPGSTGNAAINHCHIDHGFMAQQPPTTAEARRSFWQHSNSSKNSEDSFISVAKLSGLGHYSNYAKPGNGIGHNWLTSAIRFVFFGQPTATSADNLSAANNHYHGRADTSSDPQLRMCVHATRSGGCCGGHCVGGTGATSGALMNPLERPTAAAANVTASDRRQKLRSFGKAFSLDQQTRHMAFFQSHHHHHVTADNNNSTGSASASGGRCNGQQRQQCHYLPNRIANEQREPRRSCSYFGFNIRFGLIFGRLFGLVPAPSDDIVAASAANYAELDRSADRKLVRGRRAVAVIHKGLTTDDACYDDCDDDDDDDTGRALVAYEANDVQMNDDHCGAGRYGRDARLQQHHQQRVRPQQVQSARSTEQNNASNRQQQPPAVSCEMMLRDAQTTSEISSSYLDDSNSKSSESPFLHTTRCQSQSQCQNTQIHCQCHCQRTQQETDAVGAEAYADRRVGPLINARGNSNDCVGSANNNDAVLKNKQQSDGCSKGDGSDRTTTTIGSALLMKLPISTTRRLLSMGRAKNPIAPPDQVDRRQRRQQVRRLRRRPKFGSWLTGRFSVSSSSASMNTTTSSTLISNAALVPTAADTICANCMNNTDINDDDSLPKVAVGASVLTAMTDKTVAAEINPAGPVQQSWHPQVNSADGAAADRSGVVGGRGRKFARFSLDANDGDVDDGDGEADSNHAGTRKRSLVRTTPSSKRAETADDSLPDTTSLYSPSGSQVSARANDTATNTSNSGCGGGDDSKTSLSASPDSAIGQLSSTTETNLLLLESSLVQKQQAGRRRVESSDRKRVSCVVSRTDSPASRTAVVELNDDESRHLIDSSGSRKAHLFRRESNLDKAGVKIGPSETIDAKNCDIPMLLSAAAGAQGGADACSGGFKDALDTNSCQVSGAKASERNKTGSQRCEQINSSSQIISDRKTTQATAGAERIDPIAKRKDANPLLQCSTQSERQYDHRSYDDSSARGNCDDDVLTSAIDGKGDDSATRQEVAQTSSSTSSNETSPVLLYGQEDEQSLALINSSVDQRQAQVEKIRTSRVHGPVDSGARTADTSAPKPVILSRRVEKRSVSQPLVGSFCRLQSHQHQRSDESSKHGADGGPMGARAHHSNHHPTTCLQHGPVAYTCLTHNNTTELLVKDISKKQQMDSRRQVVIMLAFVVACFFLLFLPYRVFTLWLILSTEDQVQSLGWEAYYNLAFCSRILIYLHSAINPIAYNLISTKFRSAFISILLCRGPATRRQFTGEHRIVQSGTKNNHNTNGNNTTSNSNNINSHRFNQSNHRTLSSDQDPQIVVTK